MPFGRNLQIRGLSRRVCLECETRITDITKKNQTCILDRNYCAKHQPIDIHDYIINKKTLPHNYLTEDIHLKKWFEIIFKLENIISNEDIYTFQRINFQNYMSSIMSKIPNLCGEMIRLFPERNLKWYLFKIIPENYLDKEYNRRELFDAFLFDNDIDINSDKIYDISLEMLENHKASTLINHYRHSIHDIILNLYPDRILIPWHFKNFNFYCQDKNGTLLIDNIRRWFTYEIVSKFNTPWISDENEKNIYVLKNIYSTHFEKVRGGSFLWNLMNGSIFEFINKIYPEYNIKAWELLQLPCNYFKMSNGEKDLIKLREWLQWIGNLKLYSKMEDYYDLDNSDIEVYSGITILSEFYSGYKNGGNLTLLVMDVFKDYPWDKTKFTTHLDRRIKTCLKKYGVEHAMQNAEISERISKKSRQWKDYTFPCGTQVRYQGYENFAYDDLVQQGYSCNELVTSRRLVPEIWYMNNDKKHRYYVDIYIPSINKMIEVKSTWTYKKKKEDNIIPKAIECIKQGFEYEIWVYDGKKNKEIIQLNK